MGSFSIWHFLVIHAVVIVVPCWRIVKRAGYPGALALLALIPIVNITLLWVFAFVQWPIEGASPAK